ncbi:hypothetical protein Tco_0170596, partial [Tanacetum coccineum]
NTSQAAEIITLKKRVKKLEKKRRSKTYKFKRLYKVGTSRKVEFSEERLGAQEDASKQGRRIDVIDRDAEVTLVDETQGMHDDNLMFDTGILDETGEVVVNAATMPVSAANPVTTGGEVVTTASATTVEETLAQTLMEIKAAKPKAVTTAATTITTVYASTRPKAKGIVFHEQEEQAAASKPVKKDQVALDEEIARNIEAQLQAELIEEERVARQKEEESSRAVILEEMDRIQAMIEADEQLAAKLQA